MTNTIDPVPRWTRAFARLRVEAVKLRRGSPPPPSEDVTEQALAMCDSLLQELAGAGLECERLRAAVGTETATWEQLFDIMPVACLVTDGLGSILNANRAAGVFLNVSAKHLTDRQLLMFFTEREGFHALVQRLCPGTGDHRATLLVRPKERKTRETDILVVPFSNGHSGLWLWFLNPSRLSPPAHVVREAGRQGASFS
jgi:PAS domain-containing protein